MSYDTMFVQAVIGIVYLCAWGVLLATLAVGAAGEPGKAARRRALVFAGGFALTYLVINLYGTPVSQYLLAHRFALSTGGAAMILFEGISLLGIPILWARLRRRPVEDKSGIDSTGALLLGIASALVGGLCGNAQAITAAEGLGYSGKWIAAGGVMSLASLGTFIGLIGLLYLWDAAINRFGIGRWRVRAAGVALVFLAGAIVLGRVGG